MLSGTGIPFTTLRGDFDYSDNHLVIENLLAYGGAIGVTANGVVRLSQDRLDLQGTIVPAYALNSILGNIPVIGSLLLGGEGQGLFAANYRATGSAADPADPGQPAERAHPGLPAPAVSAQFRHPAAGPRIARDAVIPTCHASDRAHRRVPLAAGAELDHSHAGRDRRARSILVSPLDDRIVDARPPPRISRRASLLDGGEPGAAE